MTNHCQSVGIFAGIQALIFGVEEHHVRDDWHFDQLDTDIITASGAKGQWLFIVPKYDLVVAVTSGGTTFSGYIDPVNFLYSEILPAVTATR